MYSTYTFYSTHYNTATKLDHSRTITVTQCSYVINYMYYTRPEQLLYVYMIKTHYNESRGQEKAALCDDRVNYLHIAPLIKLQML